MNDLQKELDKAFAMISNIPVTGDGVELMAAAREHLRRAYQLAKPEEEESDRG